MSLRFHWAMVVVLLSASGCRPPADVEPPPSESALQTAVAPAKADAPAASQTSMQTTIESETPVVREDSPDPDPEPEAEPEQEPERSDSVPVAIAAGPLPRAQLPEPEGTVKPSRIVPGEYECKISREYRFRPCTVELDEHGRTILTIPHALIGIQGVLTDQGQWTHFDGIKTRDRPFGCFSCQERCTIDPGSCGCRELPPVASAQCLMEPVQFRFRKEDGQWRGRIEHHHYFGELDPEDGHPIYETDRFLFVMRR